MLVNINEIIIGDNRRSVNPERVKELAASIQEIGLLNPVTITEDKRLVAGLHRIEAYKLLGKTEIEATVVSLDELDAELAQIDENLIRNELTVLERAEQLKRRKEIYEAKYPESKSYVIGGKIRQNSANEIISFARDTASKIGVSPRTVQHEVQIAEDLADEVKEAIRNTDLADNKTELLRLARLDEEEQKEVVQKIIRGEAEKVLEAKRKIEIEKIAQRIQNNQIQRPEGLFDVIVVDPPWPYGTDYDPDGRRGACPYPEMSLEEIRNIKLPASENCVLFLWTTHKFMRYSFDILDIWGFREVAIITWVKDRMGLGTWLRSRSEFCIMAVKGSPKVNLTNQTTIIEGKVREHSRKPDEFYQMVDSLCIGRKLDYFAREKRNGWEIFGEEVF